MIGAIVIGGEHPGLGIARSLGRRGIPVVVIDDQESISRFSRYVNRVVRVKNLLDENQTVENVLEVGRRLGLKGWVLFPTRDETVAAFSCHRDRLSRMFRVSTGPWASIQWAWDKKNTYERAQQLGIPVPQTHNPRSEEDLERLVERLPLALKPSIKENFFYATGAKAWRAETAQQLRYLFHKAANQIRLEEILLQEIIPGDGNCQYSYCAFFRNGEAHSVLVARRMRQHPREFGRAATYVETVDCPEIEALSERFLRSIDYHGLVEVEFKRDPRDGQFKLLDVNARAWGFHSLGGAAGVDFSYLLFADQIGESVERRRAKAGIGWLRILTDIPTAARGLLHKELTLSDYWQSLARTKVESVFCRQDPLPSLAEGLMLPYLIAKKCLPKPSAHSKSEVTSQRSPNIEETTDNEVPLGGAVTTHSSDQ